ncbi:tRNA pseudouridine(55) synthase TruB [Actinobaculum suis]|uniref:tRNA pseudouridine(55) synthase TruB n=1 Tax=Actinobaculum suis TaxID=1657 RepID=UPI000808692B|nr:tRNA pseudouridine(55) synthase TruB [Actinobaculum suis]OCA95837.1 tRNA pseudouridine(55) synthase TruB [Actinobaculum suis]
MTHPQNGDNGKKSKKARGPRRERLRRELPWGELPRGCDAGNGVLVVNKPAGVTSHDVVAAIRRLAGTRKVGHAGTLDPLATGVLVIGVGSATRLLPYIAGTEKEYRAGFRFGIGTDTEDSTGQVLRAPGYTPAPGSSAEAEIRRALETQIGQIWQVPSAFSAKKINGQRAYAAARAGQEVELAPAQIEISALTVCGPARPGTAAVEVPAPAEGAVPQIREVPVVDIDVDVVCSAGTYVRALARDAGRAAGTEAHMTSLERRRVGGFTLAEARTIEQLAAEVTASAVSASADTTSSRTEETETHATGEAETHATGKTETKNTGETETGNTGETETGNTEKAETHATGKTETKNAGKQDTDSLANPRGTLRLMPPAQAASRALPVVTVTAAQVAALRHGQAIQIQECATPVALVDETNNLVAIGVRRGDLIGPKVVFPA